ncbi:MAG TPA: MFS transporter [Stellaceae bacterium]|jgi:MFS family permease|nr:MFS transporter [Stellaceae bacterium]
MFALRSRGTRRFLLVLCIMYFILYVDRVNLAGAAGVMQKDLGLSNTELGVAFSAFNYSYAAFQVVGGWIADRYGSRWTLAVCALIWAVTTLLTGAVGGLASLFAVRFVLGMGEGATLPAATRAMASWMSPKLRGVAQGITHSASRLGAAVTAPVVAFLITSLSWRWSFVVLASLSAAWAMLWLWWFRDDPRQHPAMTPEDLTDLPVMTEASRAHAGRVPWGPLVRRVGPTMFVYFCMGWTGWLFVTWMPSLFMHNYGLDLKSSAFFSSGTFLAGMVGDTVGGVVSDWVLTRTGSRQMARSLLIAVCLVLGLVSLIPAMVVHNLLLGAAGFTLSYFFLESAIAPMWSVTMDIAPDYAGTASALMNASGAVAGILSPVAFGRILDLTGSWTMPFAVSIGLLFAGVVTTAWMRPDRPLATGMPSRPALA